MVYFPAQHLPENFKMATVMATFMRELAGAADRAFEHRAHAKIAADGANVDRAPLIAEARVACDHHQASDFRQIGDDVFADAIGEVFLFRIS